MEKNSMILKRFLISCVLMLAAFTAANAAPSSELGPIARVAVVRQAKAFSISAPGGLKLKSSDGMKVLAKSYQFQVSAGSGSDQIRVGGQTYPSGVMAVGGSSVSVNGKGYRGHLRLVRDGSGVTAVNILPMEQYIRSVLGGEISASWPRETLKAHAIASRSYAVYMLDHPRHTDYDLAATTLDQVYPGTHGENPTITRAVDAVRGQVLVNSQGQVLKTFYSSNCGGHTADSETVFDEEHPKLTGVPDPYCLSAPNASWVIEIGISELVKQLKKAGYPVTAGSRVKSVEATGYDRSGRIAELVIKDDKGGERRINGQNLRKTIGYRRLKGTRARFSTDRASYPQSLIFEGGGWGHGVGLCQWGSHAMGRGGHSYRKIISHYYPKAKIRKP